MPIRIPDALPATAALESENIFVMTEYRALHQDIRPLRVLILNLMPTKIATETQIMRKLSNTPLQIEVELLRTRSHEAKNVSPEHLETFYRTFDEVRDERFDGLIITGAPVEKLDFADVDYWDELVEIMDWSTTNVHSTLHICWGAQAGLFHHYGIDKHELPAKLSGVYGHRLEKPSSPLVRGLDDRFFAVHSRYTGVDEDAVREHPELEVIASSDEAGLYLVKSLDSRRFFVFGHPEYDADTLRLEYERDVRAGIDPDVPVNYFPNDDPSREPLCSWRAQAQLLLHQLAQLLRVPDDALRRDPRRRVGALRWQGAAACDGSATATGRACGLRRTRRALGAYARFGCTQMEGGLRTFSCTSYTGRRRDARYSSGVIHPSPCEILPERNHRIQESRAPMNSPRAAPLQSRA